MRYKRWNIYFDNQNCKYIISKICFIDIKIDILNLLTMTRSSFIILSRLICIILQEAIEFFTKADDLFSRLVWLSTWKGAPRVRGFVNR